MAYVIEDFRLDPDAFELTHRGARVGLEPQAFDVLVHLVRQRDRVVSKEELMDSVWGGRFVTEAAVTSRIKQVRRALGDDGEAQRLIRTVHGRGYRFVGAIVEADGQGPEPPSAEPAASQPEPAPAPRRHNLVASLEPLIGRESELERVMTALATHRLVTILGTGGIGKTRLALAAAQARRDPDGPWFVDLVGLSDGSLLPESVAAALGIPSAADPVALARVLEDRTLLLILDNCEHLADDVTAFVTALLQRCPSIRVLTTSRQILAAPGEYVLDLPPLTSSNAELLFSSRAGLVTAGWSPDEREQALIAEVCRSLDHLPLAIELAAAHTRALSIDQLADQLQDRFALLRSGRGESRHASMTAAVAWSYDSLSVPERELFEALCLFEGSFALDGVMAVAGTGMAPAAVLLSLINKSLVSVMPGSPRRYRILETLRQYVGRQRSKGRTVETQRLIVGWVSALADQADSELVGPRSRGWMERLGQEKETIRATLSWTEHELDARLRIAVGMLWFWYWRCFTAEALRAFEPLSSGHSEVPGVEPSLVLRGAASVVWLRYLSGDYTRLPAALEQARALVATTDDEAARSFALATVAYFEANGGDAEQGLIDARQALELADRLGLHHLAARALVATGMAHLRAGDLAEAERCASSAVARADAGGHIWGAISASWLQGKVRVAAGDFSPATLACLVRVVNDSGRTHSVASWPVGLVSIAYVLLRRGDAATAVELVGIARRQGELIGFAPEAMDPYETHDYIVQLMAAVDDRGLTPLYERGRGLSTEQAYARVAELLAQQQGTA